MKPNLGDVIAEKYRLERVLGEGGMSTVFAAVNELTGKQVAIKWLHPEVVRDDEQCQRLLREAQATSAIDHPNVVNVFDVGRHNGALFLVMELLHGEPLSALLTRFEQTQTIAPEAFVRLMMPVLRGVHAAHRVGVVHRDLKPDNIFLCRDPHDDTELREPKVLDFGISKLVDKSARLSDELTREGTVFGTPQYMAPEQMRDARVADVRSDVYALGVVFYRALSKRYPYDADTLSALAIRVVEGNATPLHVLCPHVALGLSDTIMRALAVDPEQRFQSVAAFGHALESHARGAEFAVGREGTAALVIQEGSGSVLASRPREGDDAKTTALTLADIILDLGPANQQTRTETLTAPAPRAASGEQLAPFARTARFWTPKRRRRTLLVTAALLLGAALPVVLQQASPRSSGASAQPEPPHPSSAGARETAHPGAPAAHAEPPTASAPERVSPFTLVTSEEARPAERSDLTTVTTAPMDSPRKRGRERGERHGTRDGGSERRRRATRSVPVDDVEDLSVPIEEIVPTLRGERNPYLRR